MRYREFLTLCARELRRCAVSLLLILIGLFLATINAPAAVTGPLPAQNQCMDGQAYDNDFCYTPCKSGYSGVGAACRQECLLGYQNQDFLR